MSLLKITRLEENIYRTKWMPVKYVLKKKIAFLTLLFTSDIF